MTSTKTSVEAVREIGNAVREINEVTSNIASAIDGGTGNPRDLVERAIGRAGQRDAGDQYALAQRRNRHDERGRMRSHRIQRTGRPRDALREVETFFHNLQADSSEQARKTRN